MSLAEPLLSRLDKVRAHGVGRWMACCPAHEDKTPSLSIREEDGRVLLYCFAGCSTSAVVEAAGLRMTDLFDPEQHGIASAATAIPCGKTDPLEHERLIVELASADLRAGKQLSVEDRARMKLAIERLEAAHG